MTNSEIANNFSLLSKLIDIHGGDSFKSKSYASASFTIDKLPVQLSEMSAESMFAMKGIGTNTGKKIQEQLATGRLNALDEYIAQTPVGVMELLNIKGLGPKKIATVWKELGIESVGELLYACEENRLTLYKGFGEKTQQNIKDSINFYIANQGSYLYGQIENFAKTFTAILKEKLLGKTVEIAGDFKRQMEVIDKLQWVTDATTAAAAASFAEGYFVTITDNIVQAKGGENVKLEIICVSNEEVAPTLFKLNGSEAFVQAFAERYSTAISEKTEAEIFAKAGLAFIPPYYRESVKAIYEAAQNTLPQLITVADIKGIIHSHSNWSDGNDTLEVMVQQAIAKGFEYLVISDHSQSAFYANGLQPDRIKAQHQLVDELNEKYKPFKVFKSIESDILNDGKLDYPDEILASFDLVIASVHSNLKMTEEKAMMRLLNAITNPYTRILGHMTGRLLLSRPGYPVNYATIIEACAQHGVVIELNAHSRRLDMDWRHINEAVEKQVLISIDPDAHSVAGYDHVRFGVLAAQKAGVTKEQNLSSFSLPQFEAWLKENKRLKTNGS